MTPRTRPTTLTDNDHDQTESQAPAARILRAKETAKRLGISKTTLYDRQNPKKAAYDPNFPRPFSIGGAMKGYLESEVNAYIQHLANARAGA